MTDRLQDFLPQFSTAPIDLGSSAALTQSYEAGHAMGKTYSLDDLNQERLVEDLQQMLNAYQALIDRGGLLPFDVMQEGAGTSDVTETRRYILSRRIERAPSIRKEVLEKLPPICQPCGLDPAKHYSFRGKIEHYPLDIHHSKPIQSLAEGESRRYRVPDDFMVLCPTCHRMIHKQSDHSDLEALKSIIRNTS